MPFLTPGISAVTAFLILNPGPRLMRPKLILSALLLGALPVPARAQPTDHPKVMAVAAVVSARAALLDDRTLFARGPLRSALGDAHAQSERDPRIAEVLEPDSASCEGRHVPPFPWRVSVDSVVLGDSAGMAHLTVRRGEMEFAEQHDLRRVVGTPYWRVARIIVFEAQHHAPIRHPQPSSAP